MTRKKKIVLAVVIVVVIAVAGFLVWFLTRGGSSSGGGVYVQAVSDVNAAGTGLTNRYGGIIETQRTEEVEFDASKQLKELLVAEGDRVAAGDPLFSYDTQSTELEIQQAELEIERLNTTISNSNTQIAQLQKDMKNANSTDKLGYSAQIQQLQAEIAQTEYNIKSKQAEIEKLKASLNTATVCATMDGTVDEIADLDALLSGGVYKPDGSPSSTYITILADGDYRVKGTISEQNIYEIGQGMPVIVRSRVDDTQTWSGVIASIEMQPEENNNNYFYSPGEGASNYPFYVDLDSIDGLMLGQHVTIEMDYGQGTAKEGLWLNSGWLVFAEDGSASVWCARKAGAKLEQRTVELGDYDENMDEYQILSGLDTSEFIAWPDVDCVAGAATTTEIVVDEGDFDDMMGEGMYEDGMYEDGMSEDGMYEDGMYEDGMYEDGMIDEGMVDSGMVDSDMGVDAVG